MSKKDRALERANTALRHVIDRSGSRVLKNMPPLFYNKDRIGSPFVGEVYCHSWFDSSQEEVEFIPEDKKLQNLVQCRLEWAIQSMINLLEETMEELKAQKRLY